MKLGSRNAASADRFVTVRRICAEDLKCLGFVLFLSDAQYITCKMQNCSEATRSKPFPGYIDHNSLIVQDDYVFVQVQDTLFSYLFYYFILYYSVLHYFLFHSFPHMCMWISSQLIRQYWIQIIKALSVLLQFLTMLIVFLLPLVSCDCRVIVFLPGASTICTGVLYATPCNVISTLGLLL